MVLTYKLLMIAVGVLGLGMGVAFGAGVAYGRGDPKTVETGLTAQQIQSMLGISGAQASGGQGSSSGNFGGRGGGTSGSGSNTATSARGTTGTVQSVSGLAITIETRQGATTINLGATTAIRKLMPGVLDDIKAGTTIVVTGTRRSDGSYDATEIAQVPDDLQSLLGSGTAGAGNSSATPAAGGR